MHHLFASGVAVAALACSAITFATPVAAQIAPRSTLVFTGTADATDIGLGGVLLDFTPSRVVASQSGNTGTFASLNRANGTGVSGHIDDIRVGNGPQYDRNFLVLGGYRFALDSLPSGRYGQDACYVEPAPGQTCTPYQSVQGDTSRRAGRSPFSVANTASGNPDPRLAINSTAAFDVFGTVTGPGNMTSTFTGTIASSFIGLSYQEVLLTLEGYGLQGLDFTGTFVVGGPAVTTLGDDLGAAVVPEPSSYALVAAGLFGMGAVTARRRTRSSRGA